MAERRLAKDRLELVKWGDETKTRGVEVEVVQAKARLSMNLTFINCLSSSYTLLILIRPRSSLNSAWNKQALNQHRWPK